MTKIYRLSRADFSSLNPFLKEGGRFFTLTVAKSSDGQPHFACIVSKKTAHRAHERNRIKRRCRAAVREISPREPFAFVFTAKRSALDAEYAEILTDVRSLFVKVSPGLKGV